ncbi:DUF998 domain-containing protein [Streptomyces sp. NPDC051217]|uniref:DUF998 domain-containing protein n=1 Tax=Streptomyces sp. NPDC051217 TaxID=3365644 RepID=UPI00378983FD
MGNQLLLACGVAAGPLFTVTYLLTGAAREGYAHLRHPVSSLALGPAGWTQTAGFLLASLLSAAFAAGLWREGVSGWGAPLIGVWAIGLLGAGLFRTDPVRGYPPGTPEKLQRHTRAGMLHDLLSSIGFLALAAACFMLSTTGSSGWALYSMASGAFFVATMALSSAAFTGDPRGMSRYGGLLQRVSVTIGWTWLLLLATQTLRA